MRVTKIIIYSILFPSLDRMIEIDENRVRLIHDQWSLELTKQNI